jgi:hypothetical protein
MDIPPTVQIVPRVLLSEAPSNNGLFRLLGSVYLAAALEGVICVTIRYLESSEIYVS